MYYIYRRTIGCKRHKWRVDGPYRNYQKAYSVLYSDYFRRYRIGTDRFTFVYFVQREV